MHSPANPAHPWPRRRWFALIAVCFLAQLVLILVLGERRVSPLAPMPFKTGIHLLSDAWSLQQLAASSDMSDPSVFALPSPEGFSRAAWLTFKPVPDDFAETPDEPKWLRLEPARLGSDFAAYVATNTFSPIRIGDESMPHSPGLQPRASAELEFPKSELRIEGSLATRKLLTPIALPSWPHTDVLTNSVVHVLVDDAEGAALSSALISGSGSKEADRYALAAVKRLRFKPLQRGESVTSGTLHFRWHTLPPSANTNLSPGLLP
jgi:hypothetical protein